MFVPHLPGITINLHHLAGSLAIVTRGSPAAHAILPPIEDHLKEVAMTSQSTSDDTISRTIAVESDVQMLGHMKKQADSRGFTIMCDEREPMGGNTAPPPLAYFASSILF